MSNIQLKQYTSGHNNISVFTVCMCVGTSMIHLRYSCDKLFQAFYYFSELQVMETWVGPGNVATQ